MIKALMASKSRWFVGSSRRRMWGLDHVIIANETRDFWPPERRYIGRKARLPVIPKAPRCYLIFSEVSSELARIICSTAESLWSSMSMWCCVKTPTRSLPWMNLYPSRWSIYPTRDLTRVDLPAPLGPTSAILVSISTLILTFLKRGTSLVQPILASSSLKIGGEIFSGLGNMKMHVGSCITSSTSSILLIALILDWTNVALLALNLNLSTNF